MTSFEIFFIHSLDKVLPYRRPEMLQNPVLTGFCGETCSVQLAYTCNNDDFGNSSTLFYVEVISSIADAVRIRKVALVPCNYPCHGTWDDDYLDTRPGLYPDLLLPAESGTPIKAIPAQWRSLWIDVDAQPGLHQVTLRVTDAENRKITTLEFAIRVLDEQLPEQTLIHTQWLHGDCLADYFHIPVFSEEHWRILRNFMESAVRHGINTILTPIFTPPLDTARGGERTTIQLVKVYQDQGVYRFDFSLLERWIRLCDECGIRYLEMAHLFTQWGAVFAPKIFVSVDGGEETKLFGWHTAATSCEYAEFLRCFLPALKDFLRTKGWLEKTFFHISDEPHARELETYTAARGIVRDLLADCKVMDALSSYPVYQTGVIQRPIVSVDQIHPFLDAGVPHLWAYYCTVQAIDVPNRFIAMPSTRNRILGTLLYYYNIEGFLHWGFNFYNSQFSLRHIDPYQVTDAGEAFPSGDPFLVYPASDGSAYDSIRGMVLRQALDDLRALQYLEAVIGRAEVIKLIEKHAGGRITFTQYPRPKRFFDDLRRDVMKLI